MAAHNVQEVQHIHRRACLSWKYNVSDDFPASIQHQVAVLIPLQSVRGTNTEKERRKDREINRECYNTELQRKKEKRDRGKPKEINRNGQEDNIRTGSK